jgi:tetratricopeptide (TPR) repeat protein
MDLLVKRYRTIVAGILVVFSLTHCKKTEFLGAVPNKQLIVPNTLKDFRMLLDNPVYMNGYGVGLCPGLGEASSDNLYAIDDFFDGVSQYPVYEQIYTWDKGIFTHPHNKPEDWGFPYRCIAYSNIILEGLKKVNVTTSELLEFNDIKGGALFFRAYMYYELMQIFAPIYDKNDPHNQYGVPIRLNPDISLQPPRAKVHEVYDQILADLKEAELLLPQKQELYTRPSKAAVYGLLSRVYLSMQDYDKALVNASNCLKINGELIDYNNLSPNNFYPFGIKNNEIIFYNLLGKNFMEQLLFLYSRIDQNLYNSYSSFDLRKTIFFMDAASTLGNPDDKGYFFRGTYDGSGNGDLFCGIATDEIYLTRAECYARGGNISAAMDDLNTLMRKRWDNKVPYPTFTAINKEDALTQILNERRKELVYRGLRWTDLRRLNKEGANITINRTYKGKTYTLLPNSLSYTFPIPNDVISFNPGMTQNPR